MGETVFIMRNFNFTGIAYEQEDFEIVNELLRQIEEVGEMTATSTCEVCEKLNINDIEDARLDLVQSVKIEKEFDERIAMIYSYNVDSNYVYIVEFEEINVE